MTLPAVKKVLVVGASGNVGRSTIKALLDEDFIVTALTRETSEGVIPESVEHLKSDYSDESLLQIFKGQDAIICAILSIIPGRALTTQKAIAKAAIDAGVKVFFPSEYGVDTANPNASAIIPFLKDKIDVVKFLKTQEDKMSWVAVVSGSMFDWGLRIPGFGGINVAARTATVFDGGDIPYEATNLDQVGRAIAKSLKNLAITQNQHVYINSFTVTQNEVVEALGRATAVKFALSQGTVDGLWEDSFAQVKAGMLGGTLGLIAAAIYGKGGLAHFSETNGLWNEKLGLPQEDLAQCVEAVVAGQK